MKGLIYPIVFALMVTYSAGKRKTIERDECGAFELWACGCYPVFPEEDGIINARRLLPFWDFKRRFGGPRPSPSRTRPGKNNATIGESSDQSKTALEQRAAIVTGEQETIPSEQPPAVAEAEKSATAEAPIEASKPPAAISETPTTTPEKPPVAAQATTAAPQTPPPTEKAPEKAETPAPPPSK